MANRRTLAFNLSKTEPLEGSEQERGLKCSHQAFKGSGRATETEVTLGMMTLKLSNGSQEVHTPGKEQGWQ